MRKMLVSLVAAGGFSLAAVAPALASDPHGDWYTQYQITQRVATNNCNAVGCSSAQYSSSGVYGAHSRVFLYGYFFPSFTCAVSIYIGNSYQIFSGPNIITCF